MTAGSTYPKKGEADQNIRGRNTQYIDRVLSDGDIMDSRGARY